MVSNLPQHEEYLRKKRNKKIIRWVIVTLLFVSITGLISYISHRGRIRIANVELSGGILVTRQEVELKSLDFMQGSYLFLFPKNSAFWYPKNKLENYLKENFKRIDTINISRKDFQTISVDITERKPVAMWCDKLPSDNLGYTSPDLMEDGSLQENCYFMDQNSTIFAPAPEFSGDAYFKYYGIVSSDPIGKEYIASTTEFADLANFVSVAKTLGIHPLYLSAKDSGDFSLFIAGGGQIYFDVKEPLSKVSQNLASLLGAPALKVNGNISVEYIDLRFGNKLFYKLKQ